MIYHVNVQSSVLWYWYSSPSAVMWSTLLDPPYDDDDGDAVVVDNDVDGDARWYDCLGKCLEVTKKELHRDSSIFEWLKSRKPWMKSKKIKKWDYPIGTIQTQIENFRHIECWKIAIIGGHQLLLSSEQTKTFCVENFLLKGNISFEIVIKFCRKRTQKSFLLLMYICKGGRSGKLLLSDE